MLNCTAIAWCSKRQLVPALSSAEGEFINATSVVQEVIFLRWLLSELGFPQQTSTPMFAHTMITRPVFVGPRVSSVEASVLNILIFVGTLFTLLLTEAFFRFGRWTPSSTPRTFLPSLLSLIHFFSAIASR